MSKSTSHKVVELMDSLKDAVEGRPSPAEATPRSRKFTVGIALDKVDKIMSTQRARIEAETRRVVVRDRQKVEDILIKLDSEDDRALIRDRYGMPKTEMVFAAEEDES